MSIKHTEQLRKLPRELRSYIHQQMQDFQPFCLPDSDVAVDITERFYEDGNKDFLATIYLSGDGVEVKSEGVNEDVYRAILQAKEILLNYLNEVQRELLDEISSEFDSDHFPKTGTGLH